MSSKPVDALSRLLSFYACEVTSDLLIEVCIWFFFHVSEVLCDVVAVLMFESREQPEQRVDIACVLRSMECRKSQPTRFQ